MHDTAWAIHIKMYYMPWQKISFPCNRHFLLPYYLQSKLPPRSMLSILITYTEKNIQFYNFILDFFCMLPSKCIYLNILYVRKFIHLCEPDILDICTLVECTKWNVWYYNKHVYVTCLCYMFILHVHVTCLCYMLNVYVTKCQHVTLFIYDRVYVCSTGHHPFLTHIRFFCSIFNLHDIAQLHDGKYYDPVAYLQRETVAKKIIICLFG